MLVIAKLVYFFLLMTYLRIFIVETETESEHQIVGRLKVLQIVSDVKKGTAG